MPEKEWYRYEEDHWANREGDLITEIIEEIGRVKHEYSTAQRKRMGKLQFQKLVE